MICYEIWPPRSTGGQQVGPGPQGIRGVHYLGTDADAYPSGIEACCGWERSQHKNKAIVTDMIEYGCAVAKVPV